MYQWVINYDRHRYELRDTTTGRVVEAHVDPSADNSDLRGVSTAPLEPELVQAFRSGDHDTLNRAFGALDRASAQNLAQTGSPATVPGTPPTQRQAQGVPGAAGQPPTGDTYVRMEPEDIMAQVGRINTALDYQDTLKGLAQSEYVLRQKMIAAGQRPEDFLGSGSVTAAPPLGASNTSSTGILLDPNQVTAQTAIDRTALRADAAARTQALQEAANRFDAHLAGAANLTKLGAYNRAIAQNQQQETVDEAFASANPKLDKNIQWVGNRTTHNPGQARSIADLEQERLDFLAQTYPEDYQRERRRQVAASAKSNPDYVNQSWNIDPNDPSTFARGGVMVPAYAGGGDYGFGGGGGGYAAPSGGSWSPYGAPPAAPTTPKQPPSGGPSAISGEAVAAGLNNLWSPYANPKAQADLEAARETDRQEAAQAAEALQHLRAQAAQALQNVAAEHARKMGEIESRRVLELRSLENDTQQALMAERVRAESAQTGYARQQAGVAQAGGQERGVGTVQPFSGAAAIAGPRPTFFG
jgi:hypothetical protein